MKYQGDSDTNGYWCTWNNLQRLGKGTGKVGNRRMSKDHLNYRLKYREES